MDVVVSIIDFAQTFLLSSHAIWKFKQIYHLQNHNKLPAAYNINWQMLLILLQQRYGIFTYVRILILKITFQNCYFIFSFMHARFHMHSKRLDYNHDHNNDKKRYKLYALTSRLHQWNQELIMRQQRIFLHNTFYLLLIIWEEKICGILSFFLFSLCFFKSLKLFASDYDFPVKFFAM